MTIQIDADRGSRAAKLLHRAFTTTGIHGRTDMPEDVVPEGVERGSLEHILFITLAVSIDYQRDAPALWESARRTHEDLETRYLFVPECLHETPRTKVAQDLQRYGLSKKRKRDAHIWRTVGVTFFKKWGGAPKLFLADCGWDASVILQRLRDDSHFYNKRLVPDYPYLRGPKIGPLWLSAAPNRPSCRTIFRSILPLHLLRDEQDAGVHVPFPLLFDIRVVRFVPYGGPTLFFRLRLKFSQNATTGVEPTRVRKAWYRVADRDRSADAAIAL